MRGLFEKQDVKGLAVITLLVAAQAGAIFFIISSAVDRQIRDDAQQTTRDWANYFANRLTDLDHIVVGRAPSQASLLLMQELKQIGNVYRFKIFDADGYLKFISDQGHNPDHYIPSLETHNSVAAEATKTGELYTKIVEGTLPTKPALRAETYMPIERNGRTVAVVEVYVDQSKKLAAYRKNFSIAILSALIIVVLAFGAPAAAYFVRTRQKKNADHALAETHRMTSAVLANVAQGICMFDTDKRLTIFNDQFAHLYNIMPSKLQVGMSLHDVLKLRIEAGVFPGEDPAQYIEDRMRWVGDRTSNIMTETMCDGRTIAIVKSPMPEGGWVATHTDVTSIRQVEEKARQLSRFDLVTGLFNRVAFNNAIGSAIAESPKTKFAVLCLDLNNFKGINEALGHGTGDEMLRAVGDRILDIAGDACVVSRLGNDEFAVLQRSPEQPAAATTLAAKLCASIEIPFRIAGESINTRATIGVAMYPTDGLTPEALLRDADIALRRARAESPGGYRFFEPGMDEQIRERRQRETDLRDALDEGQFELYYQPLVDTASAKLCGCEALVRWNHPERGLVSPDDFVPMAEECGLITHLGDWVVRQAFQDASDWPDHMKVAVNLSTIQLESDRFVANVMDALSDTGIEPTMVEMEITESIFMNESEDMLRKLLALREMGIRIVMDDFGTGYSSLGYLRSFPFDKLKLDRCFTRDLGVKAEAASIVQAVAALGTSLGITTTAEGVETPEQYKIIKAAGYNEAQGYLFSRPVPLKDIVDTYLSSDKDTELFEVA